VKEVFGGLMTDIGNSTQNRIKLMAFLSTLLQGPVDVGVNLIANDQVTAIMLQMAESGNKLEQSLAAELIVLSVSKYERATALIKNGLVCLIESN
jgi:protein unc-45